MDLEAFDKMLKVYEERWELYERAERLMAWIASEGYQAHDGTLAQLDRLLASTSRPIQKPLRFLTATGEIVVRNLGA